MIHLNLQPELEARLQAGSDQSLALEAYRNDLMNAQAGAPRPESPLEGVTETRQLRKGLSLGRSIKEL